MRARVQKRIMLLPYLHLQHNEKHAEYVLLANCEHKEVHGIMGFVQRATAYICLCSYSVHISL